jgi:hypothetical protein
MKFQKALAIVLDLAEQNTLEEKQVLGEPSLRREKKRQERALETVTKYACDNEAELILVSILNDFPGLITGEDVNGADLVDTMPDDKYFRRLRRKYPKTKCPK